MTTTWTTPSGATLATRAAPISFTVASAPLSVVPPSASAASDLFASTSWTEIYAYLPSTATYAGTTVYDYTNPGLGSATINGAPWVVRVRDAGYYTHTAFDAINGISVNPNNAAWRYYHMQGTYAWLDAAAYAGWDPTRPLAVVMDVEGSWPGYRMRSGIVSTFAQTGGVIDRASHLGVCWTNDGTGPSQGWSDTGDGATGVRPLVIGSEGASPVETWGPVLTFSYNLRSRALGFVRHSRTLGYGIVSADRGEVPAGPGLPPATLAGFSAFGAVRAPANTGTLGLAFGAALEGYNNYPSDASPGGVTCRGIRVFQGTVAA